MTALTTSTTITRRKSRGFRWRAFVALTVFLNALILAISGIVLYVAPAGRIAHATEWALLGLDKDQWETIHTVLSLVFVIIVFFHVKYNWRSLLAYLKDRVRKVYSLQKELAVATALVLVVLVISIYNLPPAQQIMDLSENLNDFWETRGTEAGYYVMSEEEAHADGTETAGTETTANVTTELRGYGRLTVQEVAERAGISVETALERLRTYGIDATPDENMLTLSGRSGYTPGELAAIVQGIPPEKHAVTVEQ